MALVTPLINRVRQLTCKAEATKGTAATFTYADDAKILVLEPRLFPEFEFIEPEFSRESLSRVAHRITSKPVRLEFQTELRRSLTLDTPDKWMELFQGCGFEETINAGVSVVYQPTSDIGTQKTLTLSVNIDGLEVVVKGCMGNFVLTGEVGSTPRIAWTFRGSFVSAADNPITSVTHESGLAPIFQGINFTYDGNSNACISRLEINMQNDVQDRLCANDSTGIAHAIIGARNPELSIDPELNLVADPNGIDWWDELDTSNEAAVSFSLDGGDIAISAPKAQAKTLSDDERAGLAVAGMTFGLNGDTALDDELVFTFI